MSAIVKETSEKIKITSFEDHNTISSKKIISNVRSPVVIDPIESKRISKSLTNSLTMNSVIKAGIVFLGTVGGYYLAKTTGIFSYFNSKDAGGSSIRMAEISS